MKFQAPGDSPLLRALLASGKGVAGQIAVAASSPILARLGAVLLVVAGFAGILGTSLQVAAELQEPSPTGYVVGSAYSRLWMLSSLLGGPLALMFVGLGLAGILPLIPPGKTPVRVLAASGVIFAAVSVPPPLGLLFYQEVLRESSNLGVYPDGLYAAAIGLYQAAPLGILLAGVTALWARGLGVLRFLPLALGVMIPLAPAVILPYLYSERTALVPDAPSLAEALAVASPDLLVGSGWAILGCWMYGAKARDARLLERERRETEERNLARTRRLYEALWRDGDLSVADAILAPEFRDLRQEGGSEAFKRSIKDLRRSFPDLELEIQSQRARKDAVLTRCAFSGTDTGGVLWFPPTGRRATFTATFHDRFSGNGLAEHRSRFERESLLEQLGLPQTGGE